MAKSHTTAPLALSDPHAQRFEKLKSEIAQLEYFAKGTVLARKVKCGKPQCGCHTDPAKRHGPYYEWTYKEAGKTVNVRLDSKAASIYKAAARQYRNLKSTLNRMEKLSRLALARIAKRAVKDSSGT